MKTKLTIFLMWASISVAAIAQQKVSGPPLEGTAALTMEGDIAAQMVAGIDKFLLREIELSVGRREQFWKRDFSSPEAYNKSIEPNRERLKKILGVVDERVAFDAPEVLATTKLSGLVGLGDTYQPALFIAMRFCACGCFEVSKAAEDGFCGVAFRQFPLTPI